MPGEPEFSGAGAQERESLLPSTSGRSSVAELPAFGAPPAPFYRQPLFVAAAKNLGLIALWYVLGTTLSLWNKLLLGKEHGLFGQGAFPAPFFMSAVQFFFQHLIARALLASGIVRRKGDAMTWRQYGRTVVPNGVATGLDIGFSNYSLVFITLSFYVMCKSTTPLFLLSFAILWGIEKPSWSLAAVVSVISCGLILLVAGETRFHLLGFVLVMSAAALAGLRWTITQVLLQGNKHHGSSGGPVEVLFHLTPIMGVTLGLISLSFERLWERLPSSPYFNGAANAGVTCGILAVGGVIAFSMVWAEFMLIANTSALTFMVAGTFKEIVTVGAAVVFLHEPFTIVNAMGLVVLVGGVVLFNWLKYQRIRHGDLRPVVIDDGGPRSAASAAAAEKDRDLEGEALATGEVRARSSTNGDDAEGAAAFVTVGGGAPVGGAGLAVEMARSTSRPPSPHVGAEEVNRRRVFVLQEEEDGALTVPPGAAAAAASLVRQHSSPLYRQHSI